MNSLEVEKLIDRCVQTNVIDRHAIYFPPVTIADIINLTVAVVQQEDIEALLMITTDFMSFPNSDEATLIAIGVSEALLQTDIHLVRWFLDTLMRDAPLELRAEMSIAFENQLEETTCSSAV